MKTKEFEILTLLFENQDSFLTSEYLANTVALSQRTIRTYINGLLYTVSKNGAEIIAKQGYGYQLKMLHPIQFEMFLNKVRTNLQNVIREGDLESTLQWQNYIMNKLVLEDEKLNLEEVAEALFISRSTLAKQMLVIKKILAKYSLTLVSKTRCGTWVEGKEVDKRALILDYFFKGTGFNSIQEYVDHTNYFSDIPTASLIMIILDTCKEANIKLSDVMIQNILMHLLLSIKRIKKGLQIKEIKLDASFIESKEFMVANEIINKLEENFQITFPKEEVTYLVLHLGAKNNRTLYEDSIAMGQIEKEFDDILQVIDMQTGLSLQHDEVFRKCVLEHFKPMIIRIYQKVELKNPLLVEIKRDYEDVFNLTKNYVSQMPSLQNIDVADDEWAYVALHFMAAIERSRDKRKLQVLVVCATGVGSVELLKSRIRKEFNEYLHVVGEVGYFEIDATHMIGVDLVISTVNMSPVLFGIPILHVSVFLSTTDIKQIRSFIDQNKAKGKVEYINEVVVTKGDKEKIFDTYIREEYFRVFQSSERKTQVLLEMIDTLNVLNDSNFVQNMLTQIHLREKMGSIIFSEHVSVPHPAIPFAEVGSIAVAIVPEGFAWNEEYDKIQFVFLLSPSYLGNQGIKHLTQTIVKLIETEKIQQILLQEPTFERFREVFLELM